MSIARSKSAVQYLDGSSPSRWLAACFAYADTALFGLWGRLRPSGSMTAPMLESVAGIADHSLMRYIACSVRAPQASLYDALKVGPHISVGTSLSAVGRTSYTTCTTVEEADGGRLLAVLETVMVNTDSETHSRSQPLPHSRELQSLIVEPPAKPPRVDFVRPPAGSPVWSSVVRATDCDSLGHVNNALYPLLCEEARAALAASGALASTAAGAAATGCCVAYVGQARAFEPLSIASHAAADGAFHFVVEAGSPPAVVAEVSVTTRAQEEESKL